MAITPQRNAPDTWYPAGVSHVSARLLALSNRERARVVEPRERRDYAADVLLLHGWGCNAFHFRHLLPALARRGIRGLAVDLRGHGFTDKSSDAGLYSSEQLVAFVEEVLDALRLERAGIVGHSLGAAIALDVGVAAPERVRWLTLLNPVGLIPLKGERLLTRIPLQIAERIPSLLSRAFAWTALKLAYGRLAKPGDYDLEQYLYPTLTPGGRFGMLAYARAFSWAPRDDDVLGRIRSPLHVMLGARDHVVHAVRAQRRLAAFGNVRVDVIPGAGHVLAEEIPETVANAVAEAAEQARPNDAALDPGVKR